MPSPTNASFQEVTTPSPSPRRLTSKAAIFIKKLRIFWAPLKLRNPLDKNAYVLGNMGFDPALFASASGLFSRIRR
jgi:hypothetical protein